MKGFWATYLRELRAYFVSPLAWVISTFFLLINGQVFRLIIDSLNSFGQGPPVGAPMEFFFNNVLLWIILLFVAPVLTMRLLAEERRSGTIEMLMTAPVSEGQVVTGKYLAALTFYAFLWLPTASYAVLLATYHEVDWGPVASGYLGLLLVGGLLMAMGTFASSVTRNQIVAAVMAFFLGLSFLSLAFLDYLLVEESTRAVVAYLNPAAHLEELSRGIVDTRRPVFYFTASFFFLFLSSRALAANKWR